jgi:multiple sugar transport system substrate-binding protein
MSLTKALGKTFAIVFIAILFILSLKMPTSDPAGELSILMEPDGTGIWRELISEFNAQQMRVRVRMVEGPPATNAREDLYSTSFLSGKAAFDIVYCDVIWVAKFAAAGWLRDLTPRLSQEDREDWFAAELEAGTYRGRLYRIPGFIDASLLYYRKDLLSDPPETFDELVKRGRELKTGERWGFLWQGKQYEGLTTVFLDVLWGFGGDWIHPSTRETYLDSQEALDALRFLRDAIGTISPPGVTSYIEEDTRILFQNGHAAFLRNWPYVWTLIHRSRAPVAGRLSVTSMPHAPGHSSAATLGGWGFALSSSCADPEGAWKFVEFVIQPRQLARVQQRTGRVPSRRSLIPAEFFPVMEKARMRPPIPEYAQASDILQRWVSAALTGRVSCERALKEAARETRLLLKR